jgi:hypothetical protein
VERRFAAKDDAVASAHEAELDLGDAGRDVHSGLFLN